MAEKKPFLLRVDRELLDAVQRWASDEMRSVNGHIEYLLRDSLRRAGRAAKSVDSRTDPASPTTPE